MDEIERAAGFSRQELYFCYARKMTCFAQWFSARSQGDLDAGTTAKAGVHWRGLRLTVPGPQANPSDEVFLHWRPSLHKFHARCHYPKLSWRP